MDRSGVTCFVCATCATQFAASPEPPAACPICEDDRQYVGPGGRRWTTAAELRAAHAARLEAQGDLLGIGAHDQVGIGQRALLVPHGDRNVLWDCTGLLDEHVGEVIDDRGGLDAIAISHPHFYTTMIDWAERFDCPVHLHAADERWILRDDPRVERWAGASLDLGHGVTLHRVGGHFPGASVLHLDDGRGGTLLTGDMPLPVPDSPWVTFMWSYPNMIPLPAAEVRRIAAVLEPLAYDTLHGGFWDRWIPTGAHRAVAASAERYVAALAAVPDEPEVVGNP